MSAVCFSSAKNWVIKDCSSLSLYLKGFLSNKQNAGFVKENVDRAIDTCRDFLFTNLDFLKTDYAILEPLERFVELAKLYRRRDFKLGGTPLEIYLGLCKYIQDRPYDGEAMWVLESATKLLTDVFKNNMLGVVDQNKKSLIMRLWRKPGLFFETCVVLVKKAASFDFDEDESITTTRNKLWKKARQDLVLWAIDKKSKNQDATEILGLLRGKKGKNMLTLESYILSCVGWKLMKYLPEVPKEFDETEEPETKELPF